MTPELVDTLEISADLGRALAVIDYLLNRPDTGALVIRRIGYDLLAKYPNTTTGAGS